jgi:hypothetical protein
MAISTILSGLAVLSVSFDAPVAAAHGSVLAGRPRSVSPPVPRAYAAAWKK